MATISLPVSNVVLKNIKALARTGKSVDEIAERVNESAGSVEYCLDRMAIGKRIGRDMNAQITHLRRKGYHPSVIDAMMGAGAASSKAQDTEPAPADELDPHTAGNGPATIPPPTDAIVSAAVDEPRPGPSEPDATKYNEIMGLLNDGLGLRQIMEQLGVSVFDIKEAQRASDSGHLSSAPEVTPATAPQSAQAAAPAPAPTPSSEQTVEPQGITEPAPQGEPKAAPSPLPTPGPAPELLPSPAPQSSPNAPATTIGTGLHGAKRLNAWALAQQGMNLDQITELTGAKRSTTAALFQQLGYRYRGKNLTVAARDLRSQGLHPSLVALALHTSEEIVNRASVGLTPPPTVAPSSAPEPAPQNQEPVEPTEQPEPRSLLEAKVMQMLRENRSNKMIMDALRVDYQTLTAMRRKYVTQVGKEMGLPGLTPKPPVVTVKSVDATVTGKPDSVPTALPQERGVVTAETPDEAGRSDPAPSPTSEPTQGQETPVTTVPHAPAESTEGEPVGGIPSPTNGRRFLSPVAAEVVRLAQQNMTLGEVARAARLSKKQVTKITEHENVFLPYSHNVREELRKVEELGRTGKSLEEIVALTKAQSYGLRSKLQQSIKGKGKGFEIFQKLLDDDVATKRGEKQETSDNPMGNWLAGNAKLLASLSELAKNAQTRAQIMEELGLDDGQLKAKLRMAVIAMHEDADVFQRLLSDDGRADRKEPSEHSVPPVVPAPPPAPAPTTTEFSTEPVLAEVARLARAKHTLSQIEVHTQSARGYLRAKMQKAVAEQHKDAEVFQQLLAKGGYIRSGPAPTSGTSASEPATTVGYQPFYEKKVPVPKPVPVPVPEPSPVPPSTVEQEPSADTSIATGDKIRILPGISRESLGDMTGMTGEVVTTLDSMALIKFVREGKDIMEMIRLSELTKIAMKTSWDIGESVRFHQDGSLLTGIVKTQPLNFGDGIQYAVTVEGSDRMVRASEFEV